MNQNDYTSDYETSNSTRSNRLPLVLGLAGAALGAMAFGFVIANAVGGNGNGGSPAPAAVAATQTSSAATQVGLPTGGTSPVATEPAQPTVVPPVATEPAQPTPISPTATPIAPTPTPVPPTPTAPAVTTSKYQDFFRAEGGSVYESVKTALPLRRADASWDNSYRGCPGSAGCIRGKVTAVAALGPLTVAEHPSASALVYNTFTANRRDANLLMNVKWIGSLGAVASANADSATSVQVIVSQIDPKTGKATKALAGMPYTVMSESLGLEAIQGVDTLSLKDSRMINVPMTLTPGAQYRIELKVSCSARAALSISATTCSNSAQWTSMAVEYDQGLCSPSQTGTGCIYKNN